MFRVSVHPDPICHCVHNRACCHQAPPFNCKRLAYQGQLDKKKNIWARKRRKLISSFLSVLSFEGSHVELAF